MAKIITCIVILFLQVHLVQTVSLVQGQEAKFVFPYPCNSTKVTLQQSNGLTFYRSDWSSLRLPANQALRFNVRNQIENRTCSLELTISDLMRYDQGTYSLLVHKDGHIQYGDKHDIQVDYPPGKASCIVGDDKGGDWVALHCTANAGSLPGKIECYQNGLWMHQLTEPSEIYTTLEQTILIRKSQPVFCCSSTLNDHIERCKCNDAAMFLDDNMNKNSCPTITMQTSTTSRYLTKIIQSFESTSNPVTIIIKKIPDNYKVLFICSVSALIVVIIMVTIIRNYRWRKKCNIDSNNEIIMNYLSPKQMHYDDDDDECITEKPSQIEV